MNAGSHVAVRVTRCFSAAPERVFDARIGGSFSFVVRRQGEEIDHMGTYLEIDRPQRSPSPGE
jgi:uncharacterized protein YndB with AHSA1/START domain